MSSCLKSHFRFYQIPISLRPSLRPPQPHFSLVEVLIIFPSCSLVSRGVSRILSCQIRNLPDTSCLDCPNLFPDSSQEHLSASRFIGSLWDSLILDWIRNAQIPLLTTVSPHSKWPNGASQPKHHIISSFFLLFVSLVDHMTILGL